MPFAGLPIPPSNVPVVDPRTGDMALQWKNYYLALQNFLTQIAPAPNDALYWTSTSSPLLTNETNLGALASGYLKIATAVGVATPSTTPTIPASDISPPPSSSTATYWTSTSEPTLSAETNMGALATGYLKQTTVAGVATPSTTGTIPAADVSPVPGPGNAPYWTSTAVPGLSAETNLGALATGYLRQTTAAGTATPATVTTIPVTDISSGAALTGINDTNVTITLTGSPTAALLTATALTLGWTGLLGVARGGTNADNTAQTYQPTLSNVANIASSSVIGCHYLRVGNTVMVSGKLQLALTAASTLSQVRISLPIASAFTLIDQCGGTACQPNTFGYVGAILADTATGSAILAFTPAATIASLGWWFSFAYRVV